MEKENDHFDFALHARIHAIIAEVSKEFPLKEGDDHWNISDEAIFAFSKKLIDIDASFNQIFGWTWKVRQPSGKVITRMERWSPLATQVEMDPRDVFDVQPLYVKGQSSSNNDDANLMKFMLENLNLRIENPEDGEIKQFSKSYPDSVRHYIRQVMSGVKYKL